jgi:transposase InsO family protein
VGLALGSRAVVGWSRATPRRAAWVTPAGAMASGQRQPAAGLMRQPDRGSQDGAERARPLLTRPGLQASLSRQGHGWDQAVAERCWHTLNTEGRDPEEWETHAPAQTGVCEDIDVCYHRQRGHAAHGSLAPLAYEPTLKARGPLCPEQC